VSAPLFDIVKVRRIFETTKLFSKFFLKLFSLKIWIYGIILLSLLYQFKTIKNEKTFYYYDDYLLGWYGNVFGWSLDNCYQQ
jgi:hypothetical protein